MAHVGSLSVSEIISRGSIRAEDVSNLAAAVRDRGVVDAAEADALFALHQACGVQDASWPPFFVAALTDYVVHQAEPEGYVNAANARWLLSRIAPSGEVDTRAGLDLLFDVLDAARWVPVGLPCCALEQVLRAVRDGAGPLRADRGAPAGAITAADVALVRRIVLAFGSDGHVAVTRAEAEVLFAIDAALGSGPVEPAWIALFAGAVANVAMTASGYAVPTREAALSVLTAGGEPIASLLAAYRRQSREERALARLERQRVEIITNEEILGEEIDWLAGRLRNLAAAPGGGASTPAVQALVRLLSEPSCDLVLDLRDALASTRRHTAAA